MAEAVEKELQEEEKEEESVGSLKPRQRSNITIATAAESKEEEEEEEKTDGEVEKASVDHENLSHRKIREEKSNGTEGENGEVKQAAAEQNGARSIHLDQEQGTTSCDDVSEASSMEKHQFSGEDLEEQATAQSNFQGEFPVGYKGLNLKKIEIEWTDNPPPPGVYGEKNSKSIEVKIQSNSLPASQNYSDDRVILVDKTKSVIAEFDVERILEEQDTHDLYCPNCNSCITRRVILSKRKRIVKHHPYDAKRGKVIEIQPSHDASSSQAETTEQSHQREPDVFRCLSCFSLLVPTDCGFSIFRIFQKRNDHVNLQSSQEMPQETPSKNSNWYSFIFRSTTYIEKQSGAGSPLLEESSTTSGKEFHISEQITENISSTCTSIGTPPPAKPNPSSGEYVKGQYVSVIGKTQTTSASLVSITAESQSNTMREPNDHRIGQKIGNGTHKEPGSIQTSYLAGDASPSNTDTFEGNSFGNVIDKNNQGQRASQSIVFHDDESIPVSTEPTPETSQQPETRISIHEPVITERRREWEVLKSIVYGGLIESITSLAVVSSAAGAHTATYKIVALGLANLIGGLFLISHDLSDLKMDPQQTNQDGQRSGHYWELLGHKENFLLHAIVTVLSYIIFGLLPPVVYAFSFYKSDNKEYKLMVVAGVALICISLLALAKAHVRHRAMYFKTMAYYLGLGFAASGLSYVAGVLLNKLLMKIGLFDQSAAPPVPSSIAVFGGSASTGAWASHKNVVMFTS